jgi:hypothetical protein
MVIGAGAAHASSSEEAGFVARINSLRQSKGLAPLTVDGNLTSIGRNWSQKMLEAGAISHNPSFPSQVTSNWAKLGENVGHGGSVDSLFQAFVNSPAHYRNLVDPAFTHIGVGVVVGPDGTLWTSHQFMTLAGASAPKVSSSAPAPTTVRRTSSAPAAATATRRSAAATTTPAAPPAPPVPSVRIVLSLEQVRSLGE